MWQVWKVVISLNCVSKLRTCWAPDCIHFIPVSLWKHPPLIHSVGMEHVRNSSTVPGDLTAPVSFIVPYSPSPSWCFRHCALTKDLLGTPLWTWIWDQPLAECGEGKETQEHLCCRSQNQKGWKRPPQEVQLLTEDNHGHQTISWKTASTDFLNRDSDFTSSLQRGGILAWNPQQAAPLGNGISKAPQTPQKM